MTAMRFYDRVSEAERLATIAEPSPAEARRARALLSGVQVAYYFFDKAVKCQTWSWLPVLEREGYFRKFPEPDAEGQAWRWPAGAFVRECAAQYPECVVSIVKRARTKNASVYEDLVDALERLPDAYVARVTSVIARWLSVPSLRLPEKAIAVMARLGTSGYASESRTLLRALLKVKVTETDAQLGTFVDFVLPVDNFEGDLQHALLELVRFFPALVVGELQKMLIRALHQRDRARGRRQDFSYIWRSHVASDDHLGSGPENILTSFLRDVLLEAATCAPEHAEPILRRYLDGRRLPYVLTRIALHLIAREPDRHWDLVERAYARRGWTRSGSLEPEYRELLQDTFGLLMELNRPLATRTLKRISRLPEEEQLRWLSVVELDLTGHWRGKLRTLREKPSRVTPTERPGVLAAEQALSELPVRDVPSRLGSWDAKQALVGPDLAHQLEGDVRARPGEYSGALSLFYPPEVHPRFVAALLGALEGATEEKKELDWTCVLNYCRGILELPPEVMCTQIAPEITLSPDWHLVAIARLLDRAVRKQVISQIDATKQVLLAILQEAEQFTPDSPADSEPWSAALNDAKGQAIAGLVTLAQNSVISAHPEVTVWPGWHELDTEVATALDSELSFPGKLSLGARAVIGQYLPVLAWLDTDWVRHHLTAILPSSDSMRSEWWAAWGAYLFFNPYYSPMMELLRHHYLLATDRVADPNRPKWASGGDDGLALHIMNAMCREREPYGRPDSLAHLFFEKAPSGLRAEAVNLLGRWFKEGVLRNVEQEQLKALWAQRVQDPAATGEELAEFSWWLDADPWPPSELDTLIEPIIPHLPKAHRVIKLIDYLGRHSEDQPASLLLLARLVELPRPFWVLYDREKESIRKVLQHARAARDPDTLDQLDYVVNRLGELGQREFRGFLP